MTKVITQITESEKWCIHLLRAESEGNEYSKQCDVRLCEAETHQQTELTVYWQRL